MLEKLFLGFFLVLASISLPSLVLDRFLHINPAVAYIIFFVGVLLYNFGKLELLEDLEKRNSIERANFYIVIFLGIFTGALISG